MYTGSKNSSEKGTRGDRDKKLPRGAVAAGVVFVLLSGIVCAAVSGCFTGLQRGGETLKEVVYTQSEQNGAEERKNTDSDSERASSVTVSGSDDMVEQEQETAAEEAVKEAYRVVIDAGHGGMDEGCAAQEVLEKDINLTLAMALCDRLQEMGFAVSLTRTADSYLTLEERVNTIKEQGADLLLSIHQNSCEETNVQGIETWYNGTTDYGKENKRLAQLIQQQLVKYTKSEDRGIREDEELVLLRESELPSCIVETGFLSNAAERGKMLEEEYREKLVQGLAAAVELYFFPKTMYLTFDDGPSAENTDAILDILQKYDIKATFFVIGENVKKYPETAKRIVDEGHTIGIHCNWHDYRALYEGVDSYVTDFEQARQTVYEVTGAEATLFRFPGGSINAYNQNIYRDIVEEMTQRGYIYFDWNASLEDAVSKSQPKQLIANAKNSTLGRKKIVMLAHDTVHNTALCLEELLGQFPEYLFCPLSEEVEPIQF